MRIVPITVNVLQDKWADQLLGQLALGERLGTWQKEFCWLESHLIGDPTYRFTPVADDAASKRMQRVAQRNEEQMQLILDKTADPTDNQDLRIVMAEALGWFCHSIERDKIAAALNDCLAHDKSLSPRLRREMAKAVKRIQGK